MAIRRRERFFLFCFCPIYGKKGFFILKLHTNFIAVSLAGFMFLVFLELPWSHRFHHKVEIAVPKRKRKLEQNTL